MIVKKVQRFLSHSGLLVSSVTICRNNNLKKKCSPALFRQSYTKTEILQDAHRKYDQLKMKISEFKPLFFSRIFTITCLFLTALRAPTYCCKRTCNLSRTLIYQGGTSIVNKFKNIVEDILRQRRKFSTFMNFFNASLRRVSAVILESEQTIRLIALFRQMNSFAEEADFIFLFKNAKIKNI